ncbi:hypothetical protein GCM10027416_11100 [Okibacterium endophyticum]
MTTKTAFSKHGKILTAAFGLAGVVLALTGCSGSPDIDGTYFTHHNNDSAQAVISGSTIELYMIDCVDDQPAAADEPSLTGKLNGDFTELTLQDEDEPVAISISDGVLTIGGEVYTQMSEAEGLAASHVCS